MDEFEKRMHFSAFVTTLSDTITKMNPATLLNEDTGKMLAESDLKELEKQAMKKWLDMDMAFMDKANRLGSQYPIEELLGIPVEVKGLK